MRSKKAIINITVSILLQLVTIVCGFITPRLILTSFGSGYNGITSSVTQFLSIITLLRAGVGGVTRASLYKPLAEKNTAKISAIVRATEKFMRKIAFMFIIYLVFLAGVYPLVISRTEYGGWLSLSSYVIILGIGTFAQYYFSITYQLLLTADQREYIANLLQIVQTILNTIVAVVFINAGFGLHVVKLGSAAAYMITPITLHSYVKKRYHLIHKIEPDNVALAQRWDAFAHSISDFIHGNTDLMVLTLLAGNITIVSVYSVYYLVINGIKKLVTLCTTGLEAALGNMIAKKEYDTIQKTLRLYETVVFTITTILFICMVILIVPFVMVYTKGVYDVDYRRPLFAVIAALAEGVYCIRIPYSSVVYAVGHYRQTRNSAVIEALLNLGTSILAVLILRMVNLSNYAIIGVALGTLIANTYRTIDFIRYASVKVLNRPIICVLKRVVIMFVEGGVLSGIAFALPFGGLIDSYFSWCAYAVVVFIVVSAIVGLVELAFYKDDLKMIITYVKNIFNARKKKYAAK